LRRVKSQRKTWGLSACHRARQKPQNSQKTLCCKKNTITSSRPNWSGKKKGKGRKRGAGRTSNLLYKRTNTNPRRTGHPSSDQEQKTKKKLKPRTKEKKNRSLCGGQKLEKGNQKGDSGPEIIIRNALRRRGRVRTLTRKLYDRNRQKNHKHRKKAIRRA